MENRLASTVQRLEALTNSAIDAIVSADENGVITNWNPAASSIFGYTNEDAIGQSLEILIPERFRLAHRRGMARVASGGPSHIAGSTIEVVGLRKDATEFPIELSLSKWQVDETIGFTGIIRDVSHRIETLAHVAKLSSLLSGLLGGQVVGGRYRLETLLDSQTFWDTYDATDLEQRESVWLRIVRPPTTERVSYVMQGALDNPMEAVDHPHAVDVLEQGRSDFLLPFVVTEALSGESLAHHLERRYARGLRVELASSLQWLDAIASVIATAHEAGMVHADVSATHIFLHQPLGRAVEVKVDCLGLTNYCRRSYGAGEQGTRSDDVRGLGRLAFQLMTGQSVSEVGDATPAQLIENQPRLSQALVDGLIQALNGPNEVISSHTLLELIRLERKTMETASS